METTTIERALNPGHNIFDEDVVFWEHIHDDGRDKNGIVKRDKGEDVVAWTQIIDDGHDHEENGAAWVSDTGDNEIGHDKSGIVHRNKHDDDDDSFTYSHHQQEQQQIKSKLQPLRLQHQQPTSWSSSLQPPSFDPNSSSTATTSSSGGLTMMPSFLSSFRDMGTTDNKDRSSSVFDHQHYQASSSTSIATRSKPDSPTASSILSVVPPDDANSYCCVGGTTAFAASNANAVTSPAGGGGVEAAEKLLSRQMQGLSMKERQEVLEDIHGTNDIQDETDTELVKDTLRRFDAEITTLRKRHLRNKNSNYCAAYEKARFLNPQLVEHDVDFKLMFLRADNYNPERAANRYMMYFTTKLELFGLDNLTKQPLTYEDDLSQHDKDILCSGWFQPLPLKDSVGRPILVIFPTRETTKLSKSHFRAMWYLRMSMMEQDVDAQRKGIVEIVYLIGGTNMSMPSPEMPQKIENSLPVRHVAMHIVHDHNKGVIGAFMSLLPMIAPIFKFMRFRAHCGTYMEVSYQLKTFGIPGEHLPVDKVTGRAIDTTYLCNHYLLERREIENKLIENQRRIDSLYDPRHPDATSVSASTKDVLLGRGRPFFGHPGNLHLFRIVGQYRSRYAMSMTYGKKNEICDEIVELIHQSGGRFLKQKWRDNDNDGNTAESFVMNNNDKKKGSGNNSKKKKSDMYIGWEVVDWDAARDKVSHAFRSKPPSAASGK